MYHHFEQYKFVAPGLLERRERLLVEAVAEGWFRPEGSTLVEY